MVSRYFFILVILAALFSFSTGDILCYTCVYQGGGDKNCLTNPAAVTSSTPVTKCPFKYCTIRRLEYVQEPGVVVSFLRGCEDNPLPNGENGGDSDTILFAQSCNFDDLCNLGDGLSEIVPGGNGNGGDGGNIIIVPGSSAALQKPQTFLVVSLFSTVIALLISLS